MREANETGLRITAHDMGVRCWVCSFSQTVWMLMRLKVAQQYSRDKVAVLTLTEGELAGVRIFKLGNDPAIRESIPWLNLPAIECRRGGFLRSNRWEPHSRRKE